MAENNRNQEKNQTPDTGSSNQSNQNPGQAGQTQNTSGQQQPFENAQRGSQWSNYQTREMSDEGYNKEGAPDSDE